MNDLSREVFEYIKTEIAGGAPPSVRDIARALSIKSTSTVHKYILDLEAQGLISHMDNKRRTIVMSRENKADVPILGNVAAGNPLTAIDDVVGYISYSGFTGDQSELFALTVKGTSMINIGILEGDIIIIRSCPTARNGQLVVAMVDGAATVKRYYKEDGHFRLHPENNEMEDMIFDEITVLGVVIADIRRYE